MSDIDVSKLSVGDIVIWRTGSKWSRFETWGRVTRITPKLTVFAKVSDDATCEHEFRKGDGLRIPSKAEVATAHWESTEPRLTNGHLSGDLRRLSIEILNEPITAEKVEAVIAELQALTAWLKEKP